MTKTLLQKQIQDGKIALRKYTLGDDVAPHLNRPVGTREIVITYDCPGYGKSTNPTASWYLTQEYFVILFDLIKNKSDFERVHKGLDEIHDQASGLVRQMQGGKENGQ